MLGKEQKKEKYVCKFYLQGSCKNGSSCKFFHPVNLSKNNQNQNNLKFDNPKPNKNEIPQNYSNNHIECDDGNKKVFRDEYSDKMIDSMRIVCFACARNQLLVYLSCGCSSICQDCAKKEKPCGLQQHKYDPKVYIK